MLEKSKQEKLTLNKSEMNDSVAGLNPASPAQELKNPPPMVPLHWLTPEQAEALGYEKAYNIKRAISRIDNNQPFIEFAISNITTVRPELRNIVSIKLLGPILRLRIALFAIILTALSPLPLLASTLCFLIESSYLALTIGTTIRYKFARKWLVITSKINVSLAIIVINLIGMYLAIN